MAVAAAGSSRLSSREIFPPAGWSVWQLPQTSPDRTLGDEAAGVETLKPRIKNVLQGGLGESCVPSPPTWLDWVGVKTDATCRIHMAFALCLKKLSLVLLNCASHA